MSLFAGLIKATLPLMPKAVVRHVAMRYVAGETLADALNTARNLAAEGADCTMDILGESVEDRKRAEHFTEQYLELAGAMQEEGLNASASVKLSMLGLSIDPQLCRDNLNRICAAAARHGLPVTIDMEDSSTTDATLALWRQMRTEHGEVGCVLQAYMRRSMDDVRALPPASHVRLCKGIYVEPEEIAYKGFREVRENYVSLLDALLDGGHYVGIATHDDWLIARAEERIAARGLTTDMYEFQMLLGVKPALRRRLIDGGHALRVYVPYGADWYPYSLRRLRENPQVGVHIAKAVLGLG